MHRTWECYSQAPLQQIANAHYKDNWAEDLDWYAAAASAQRDCALLFGIDPLLGLLISGEMFDLPSQTVGQEDVQDALGEITHTVARSITTELGMGRNLQPSEPVTSQQCLLYLNEFNVESEMLAQSDHHFFYSALVRSKVDG